MYMRQNGGFLRYEDLAAHTSNWIDPVSTDYRGYTVWELPPNGQGIAALQMLNILEAYDIASMGFDSAEYVHLLVEAKKLAYEDRAKFYADPEFNEIPVDWLISKEYATQRRTLIDLDRAATEYDPGDPLTQGGDTIYLTVADKDGNLVSLIQSNYSGHGSGMTPPTLGFCFQNRGALFNLGEGHFNTYQSRKTSVSHDHSCIRDQGWPAVTELRGDGRCDAAARACANSSEHDRLRDEHPRGG